MIEYKELTFAILDNNQTSSRLSRLMIRNFLEEQEYKIYNFYSTKELLQLLNSSNNLFIDVLFIDSELTNKENTTGLNLLKEDHTKETSIFEVINSIKEQKLISPETEIVLLTNKNVELLQEQAKNVDIRFLINKPLDIKKLRSLGQYLNWPVETI